MSTSDRKDTIKMMSFGRDSKVPKHQPQSGPGHQDGASSLQGLILGGSKSSPFDAKSSSTMDDSNDMNAIHNLHGNSSALYQSFDGVGGKEGSEKSSNNNNGSGLLSMGERSRDSMHADGGGGSSSINHNKKPHIKKPLNAFMLYMKEMRANVVAECTLKESAAINQILGRRVSKYIRIYLCMNN